MRLGLISAKAKPFDPSHNIGPTGLSYLISYLEKELGVLDSYIEFYYENLMAKKPDIVGISTTSENFNIAKEIAKNIRKLNSKIPIIIGGPHITALPESIDENMDVGVVGEGEIQFAKIIKLILKNELNEENLKNIKGVVFRNENKELILTERQDWIKNIDDIPPPKRKPLAEIGLKAHDLPLFQSLVTTRGCPFKCVFCSASRLWEKPRYHSVERIFEETLEIVRNYPNQKIIPIVDDLFAINKNRLRDIVKIFKSENITKKVSFTCQARASCFDEEIASLLSEMNVMVACFGFESGNDRVLKYLKGGSTSKDVQNSIDLCEKYNLKVAGSFIIGSPTETLNELANTYWLTKKNKDKIFRTIFCISTPFPGTPFWQEGIEKKVIPENFQDWELLNLSYDKDKTIFLGDQYSRDEFTAIHEVFADANTHPLVSNQDSMLKDMEFNYIKSLYKKVSENINNPSVKILEISSHKEYLTNYINSNNIKRLNVLNGKVENLEEITDKYDYIFIPHTLEQIRDPQKLLISLKSLLEDSGNIIIISYNIMFISIFISLLKNTWNLSNAGIQKNKNLFLFSIESLNKMLEECGYKNISIEKTQEDVTPFLETYKKILPLFSKFANLNEYMINSISASFIAIYK